MGELNPASHPGRGEPGTVFALFFGERQLIICYICAMKEFIQGIHPDVFSAAIQILSVVCGLMFVLSLRARRSLKLLRSTPLVKIGAAPGNGLVAVSGRVEAIKGGGVVAPLTGAPCLWYRCRVDRFAPDPSHKTDSSSSWRYIGAHSSGMPFVLSDGSAACVVVPDVA
ncbi:MAG: hypothetical protein RL417_407, partial [Pseudomonadota bacterium]